MSDNISAFPRKLKFFLFSCYTGLAYADVKALKRSGIIIGVDGEQWLVSRRQKTDISAHIPLLPAALTIINKYKDHPQCQDKDQVLPILSNQKMNAYLKVFLNPARVDYFTAKVGRRVKRKGWLIFKVC